MGIIVFDLDDTIANTADTVIKYAAEYHSGILKRENKPAQNISCADYFYFADIFDWGDGEISGFFDVYYPKYLKEIECKDNASCITKHLHKCGWEIHILTSRIEVYNFDVINATKDWLYIHDILYDKLKIGAVNKNVYLSENEACIFVDDSYVNCMRATSIENLKVFMVETPFNKYFENNNITKIDNLLKIVEYL